MQKPIQRFLKDLKTQIRKTAYNKRIVSVVLLGSAAQGEWIRGESDIDMIIVVKTNDDKKPISEFFQLLMKKLNKKHRLKLEDTTAIYKKYKNPVIAAFMKIEESTLIGRPYYIISLDDYDFIKNKIKDPRVWFLATFVGPLNIFLLSLKRTGKTIYGKNLLKYIDVKVSSFERFKLGVSQAYFILASLIMLPFNSKLALKHSIKATLHQEEDGLLLLGKIQRAM